MRVACWLPDLVSHLTGFLSSGLLFGNSMGMVLVEVLKVKFDLRHAAGCDEDFAVNLRLS